MEVEYVLGQEDVLAFYRYHLAHPPKSQRRPRLATCAVLVLVGLFSLSFVPGIMRGEWTFGVVLGLCLFVLFLAYSLSSPWVALWYYKRLLRRGLYARKMGWHKLSLTPEALAYADDGESGTVKWHAIEKIARTESHAFFYTSDLTAHVLPRRPFAGDQEFEEFVETARQYRRAALDARRTEPGHPSRRPVDDDVRIKPAEGVDR